jgi:hypothetical protein
MPFINLSSMSSKCRPKGDLIVTAAIIVLVIFLIVKIAGLPPVV